MVDLQNKIIIFSRFPYQPMSGFILRVSFVIILLNMRWLIRKTHKSQFIYQTSHFYCHLFSQKQN